MTQWRPLSIGSSLYSAPSITVPAPVMGKLERLPFSELPWEDFERLLWRIMHDVEGLRNAHLYGDRGQAQYGIDIIAAAPDETGVALQSKRYEKFRAADLRRAVHKFRTTALPLNFKVERLIVGISTPVKTTQVVDELATQRKLLHPIELELWDADRLSSLLRDRPAIVVEFFGQPTAEGFCLPFKVEIANIPPPDVVAIQEAIARTPEVTTGAKEYFDQADTTNDPAEALSLIEQGQERLKEYGFGPHASQYDYKRARLAAETGLDTQAARYILDAFWRALDYGHTNSAQNAQSQLNELSHTSGNEPQIAAYREVCETAFDLYSNPLGYTPGISTLQIGDPNDMARLTLLAGETALANDNKVWLRDAASTLQNVSLTPTIDLILQTRLRLLAAEASSNWNEILREARKLHLGNDLSGLVTARYARSRALTQNFEEADALWQEASGYAVLAQLWNEASTWILSQRIFRARWNPFTSNNLLPLQTAIREMGPSAPLISSDRYAYENALTALGKQKLRPAAISAQRALRDAVVMGDWFGEAQAREVLGKILAEADEPELAAHHLSRAGSIDAIISLGKSRPNEFINVSENLEATNYWTLGTTYRLYAIQADLIPDELIDVVSQSLIQELEGAGTKEFRDLRSFNTSRYGNAVKAITEIAERLNTNQSSSVVTHFEKQPELDDRHYRLHDDDEAILLAKIATTHPQYAERVVPHLVQLLSRAQSARKFLPQQLIEEYLQLARPALNRAATHGNRWAQETLALNQQSETNSQVIDDALKRLTTPLAHKPGVFTSGTTAIDDARLIEGCGSEKIGIAVCELLQRADTPEVNSLDRGQYLVAASNLVEYLSLDQRDEFFDAAVQLVTAPTPSDSDKLNKRYTHKLGFIRVTGEPRESTGQAVLLAARLASNEGQRNKARLLAYRMLGTESDYWPARALFRLGRTPVEDLAFLASQGWASRGLAASLWVKYGQPTHLGERLAADEDVRVRRELARAIASKTIGIYQVVRDILIKDPAYSVRKLLNISPGANPETLD